MCLVVSMVACVSGWLHVSGGVYGSVCVWVETCVWWCLW